MNDNNFLLLLIFISLFSFVVISPFGPALAVAISEDSIVRIFRLGIIPDRLLRGSPMACPEMWLSVRPVQSNMPHGDGLVQDSHLFPRTILFYHNLLYLFRQLIMQYGHPHHPVTVKPSPGSYS